MRVPKIIMINGERKAILWVSSRRCAGNKRFDLFIEGLCKMAMNERYRQFPEDVARIAKAISVELPPFLERYGEDLYVNTDLPLPAVMFINGHEFKRHVGFESQCHFRNVDGVLFAACRAILEDEKIDLRFARLITVCNFISDFLNKVFTENAREIFCKEIHEAIAPIETTANYLNVPKSIAISGRVINIEWLSRAYLKEPDKMRERFVCFVVREILRTILVKQASEYRSIVIDTISRGLTRFLKQYAHLMFNPDATYPYKTLANFPDEVEIDGRFWIMDRFKRPDVSSRSAISGIIAEVAEIYLSENPLISFDYFELRSLAKSFASKFCTFIELNAIDLFGERPTCEEEFVRPIEVVRREELLDQNAALKQKVKFLSDENGRLRECIAALILKETK